MVENPGYPAMMDKDIARQRFQFHLFRLQRNQHEREALLIEREREVLNLSANLP
jgi:hypothetical protein